MNPRREFFEALQAYERAIVGGTVDHCSRARDQLLEEVRAIFRPFSEQLEQDTAKAHKSRDDARTALGEVIRIVAEDRAESWGEALLYVALRLAAGEKGSPP